MAQEKVSGDIDVEMINVPRDLSFPKEESQTTEAPETPEAPPPSLSEEDIIKKAEEIYQKRAGELTQAEKKRWQSVADRQVAEERRKAQQAIAEAQAETKLYEEFIRQEAGNDEQMEFRLWQHRRGRERLSPPPPPAPQPQSYQDTAQQFTSTILGQRLEVLKEAGLEATHPGIKNEVDLSSQEAFLASERDFQKSVAVALKHKAEEEKKKTLEEAQRKWKETGGPKTDSGSPSGGSRRSWTQASIRALSDADWKKFQPEIMRAMEEGRIKE